MAEESLKPMLKPLKGATSFFKMVEKKETKKPNISILSLTLIIATHGSKIIKLINEGIELFNAIKKDLGENKEESEELKAPK